MSITAFALLMTGVLLNAAAQLLLKAGTNALGVLTLSRHTWADTLMRMATQSHFVLGAACYVLSLFVWILGLSRVPVSVAYPLLSVGYIINDRRRRRRSAFGSHCERPLGASVRGRAFRLLRRTTGARPDLGHRRRGGRAAACRHRPRR
jgi:multidrug transporter EmrE-like cation transporter